MATTKATSPYLNQAPRTVAEVEAEMGLRPRTDAEALAVQLPHTAPFIADAVSRNDAAWTWHRHMSPNDRAVMDSELVTAKHPLAYEAGTQWHRFQALCAEWKGAQ